MERVGFACHPQNAETKSWTSQRVGRGFSLSGRMSILVLQWYVGLSGQANVDSGHRHPDLAFCTTVVGSGAIPRGAALPQFHRKPAIYILVIQSWCHCEKAPSSSCLSTQTLRLQRAHPLTPNRGSQTIYGSPQSSFSTKQLSTANLPLHLPFIVSVAPSQLSPQRLK